MRSTWVFASWCLALMVGPGAAGAAAATHGGIFVGPPTSPVQPVRPATGQPARPGVNPVIPVSPGLTGRGGLLQPNRGRTRATGLTPGTTLERWENWWRHNREPYLPRHSGGVQLTSSIGGFLTGRTGSLMSPPGRFRSGEIRSTILPVLASVLGDRSPDVVDSAIIAMARVTKAEESAPFLMRFARALVHDHRSVREAAILALGILGSEEAAEMLRSILRDDRIGRQLVGETISIDDRHRSMAALALGLVNEAQNVPLLLDVVRSARSTRQLASCAVLSLGLHQDGAYQVAVELSRMLKSPTLDREVRAQVPVAFMRLPSGVARTQLATMVELLKDRDSPLVLRRSLAIALGNLATPEDEAAREVLQRALKKDADVMVRNFSCIALGRIAERATRSVDTAESVRDFCEEASSTLVREMRAGKNQRVQPYAALGLGLMLRSPAFTASDDKMTALSKQVRAKLRENFLGERDPSLQSAGAIALGLAGDPEQAEAVRQRLLKTKNPALMGYLAESLGMLGDLAAVPYLRTLLAKPGRSEEMRMSVARALGLLNDPGLQTLLIRMLREAQSIPEASAVANGLGLSGDRSSAAALLQIVPDEKEQSLRRAFAIVALGLLAEKTVLPWNVVYSVDSNYTLDNDALKELLKIL